MILTLIHYISAERRLNECEKTIIMLGGSQYHDENIPTQLAAQREMIKIEVKYYSERLRIWFYLLPVGLIILAMIFVLFEHFGVI